MTARLISQCTANSVGAPYRVYEAIQKLGNRSLWWLLLSSHLVSGFPAPKSEKLKIKVASVDATGVVSRFLPRLERWWLSKSTLSVHFFLALLGAFEHCKLCELDGDGTNCQNNRLLRSEASNTSKTELKLIDRLMSHVFCQMFERLTNFLVFRTCTVSQTPITIALMERLSPKIGRSFFVIHSF